jgi:transcriptional regulator with XRE-family HTH domain
MTLKTLLKLRGLRQEDLAEKVGVEQASVSRWMSGVNFPTAAFAQLTATTLRVQVDWKAFASRRLQFKGFQKGV